MSTLTPHFEATSETQKFRDALRFSKGSGWIGSTGAALPFPSNPLEPHVSKPDSVAEDVTPPTKLTIVTKHQNHTTVGVGSYLRKQPSQRLTPIFADKLVRRQLVASRPTESVPPFTNHPYNMYHGNELAGLINTMWTESMGDHSN